MYIYNIYTNIYMILICIYANYMFIICLLFDFCFLSFFYIFVFFSNTIKRHKSRLNRRLNPGLKSLFFLTLFQCSADFPSSSFKISILQQSFLFSICWFVDIFLFMFLWVFCWVSVFQLFLFCFFFFWIVFYVQSFCGIVVFYVYFFGFYLFP